jgi:hypothetical protein
MCAQAAHQSLCQHTDQRRFKQKRRHPQIEQSGDRAGGIIGMQRSQHKMPGECRLYCHLCSFEVANFADHDDVRVLPHQCPDARSETQIDARLHLKLIECRLDHLDGVFNRAYIDLVGRQLS